MARTGVVTPSDTVSGANEILIHRPALIPSAPDLYLTRQLGIEFAFLLSPLALSPAAQIITTSDMRILL
jgi:hypothetical protein